jgi:hypothetical protein
MTDTPKFTPIYGRQDRRFDRMIQAVWYSRGYDDQMRGSVQLDHNEFYELGRTDADEDARKPADPMPITFAQFLERRKAKVLAGKTFDQLLDEVRK